MLQLETPLSDEIYKEKMDEHEKFNEQCRTELATMHTNLINNVIARGGVSGWEICEQGNDMRKSFEFASFEQAQAFCQNVAKHCNQKDHHPEWSLTDGGRTVNARLTSHFANNTLTVLDYEIAEHMNTESGVTKSSFVMNPRYTADEWIDLKYMVATGAFVIFWARFLFNRNYLLRDRNNAAIPKPLAQIDGELLMSSTVDNQLKRPLHIHSLPQQ